MIIKRNRPLAPEKYRELNAQGRELGEGKRDCGVIALAVACSVPYGRAHAELAKVGRKKNTPTYVWQIKKAAAAFGFVTVTHKGSTLNFSGRIVCREPRDDNPLSKAKGMVSAERVLRKHFRGRRFLLGTSRHIAAFDGDVVQDFTRGRKHHVTEIIEILPVDGIDPRNG